MPVRIVTPFAAAALCVAAASFAQPDPLVAASGEAMRRIEQRLGQGACTSDAQCRVVGVGARSCGGPESFHAYSTLDVDEGELRQLIAKHAELRRQAQQRSGEMSTCDIQEPPVAVCRVVQPSVGSAAAGRCSLTAARRGAGVVHSR